MLKKLLYFIVITFFGFLGIHYFMKKNYATRLVYFFTCGFLGIGWLYDIYRVLVGRENEFAGDGNGTAIALAPMKEQGIMPSIALNAIRDGVLPDIKNTGLILEDNEECVFINEAYTLETKDRTTGYKSSSDGVSIRIAKGIYYRTGSGQSRAVKEA